LSATCTALRLNSSLRIQPARSMAEIPPAQVILPLSTTNLRSVMMLASGNSRFSSL